MQKKLSRDQLWILVYKCILVLVPKALLRCRVVVVAKNLLRAQLWILFLFRCSLTSGWCGPPTPTTAASSCPPPTSRRCPSTQTSPTSPKRSSSPGTLRLASSRTTPSTLSSGQTRVRCGPKFYCTVHPAAPAKNIH